mmetsp:Transcript_80406/g.217797  ORF Transcript_80406/g.217797 Transcript_80406/m.217797 type:complete len:150 (-) Transcript_80406:215-664(-)
MGREPLRGAAVARAAADRLVQRLQSEIEKWKAKAEKFEKEAEQWRRASKEPNVISYAGACEKIGQRQQEAGVQTEFHWNCEAPVFHTWPQASESTPWCAEGGDVPLRVNDLHGGCQRPGVGGDRSGARRPQLQRWEHGAREVRARYVPS